MDNSRYLLSFRLSVSDIARALVDRNKYITGYPEQSHPFPPDVRYLRAYYDPQCDEFEIILEHPDFMRTAPGAVPYRAGLIYIPFQAPPMIEGE